MEATNMAKSKAIFAPKVNLTKYNYSTTHKFYKSSRIMGVTRRFTLMTISSRPPHACAALVKKKDPVGVTAASEAVTFTGIAEVTVRKSGNDLLCKAGLGWIAALAYTKQAEGGVTFELVSTETYTGAILVRNNYDKEFFLESIKLEGIAHFECNSWIQPRKLYPKRRIFFSNKAYLPNKTPRGLEWLREKELMELRGDGSGLRIQSDRIYDYEVYNDLGNPKIYDRI